MNHLKPCYYSTRLLNKLKSLDDDKVLDFDLINKAIYWAKKYHDGQFRKSGEPFYTHPLEVAYMVSEHNLTTNVIVTSVLHDIIEDTDVTAGMILDAFGWRIAEMVDRLTRDRPDGTKISVEEMLNNAYIKKDEEVLLIKVVDRIHNLQTIDAKNKLLQNKSLIQTLKSFLIVSIHLNQNILESHLYHLSRQLNSRLKTGLNLSPQSKFCYDYFDSYSLPEIQNN